MPSPLDTLTQINLDDLVNAFGWQNHARLSRILRRLFLGPARLFAQQILDFDAAIGARGLIEASRRIERLYARDVRVFCADLIPAGPILTLANHPGLTDTLALFCALRRDDLKIIALDRPFLQSLPHISNQLFYVTDDSSERVSLVRRVSGHLRAGGAALTFPAGHTEPDPEIYGGAVDSLQRWTDSVGIFIRLAPETAVLPICVRGVTWNAAAQNPLTRLRRTHDDQQLLASALQLLSHLVLKTRPVTVNVQIGRPITVKALGTTDTQVIHQAVLAEMKRLIENPPEGEGVSAL
ncbi:MAG: glycerol acyltransferase [Chloroflexi bacterium]|nr:glycerol acyltransferase [Chloroflexota bacterium]